MPVTVSGPWARRTGRFRVVRIPASNDDRP